MSPHLELHRIKAPFQRLWYGCALKISRELPVRVELAGDLPSLSSPEPTSTDLHLKLAAVAVGGVANNHDYADLRQDLVKTRRHVVDLRGERAGGGGMRVGGWVG